MTLCPLGQAIFAKVTEGINNVPPVRTLIVQLYPEPLDRAIDLWLDAATVMLCSVADLGAQAISLIDHQSDHLRHTFKRRGGVWRQGG